MYKVLIRITEADRCKFILCLLALLGNSTLVIHGLGNRFIFYVCFISLYSKQWCIFWLVVLMFRFFLFLKFWVTGIDTGVYCFNFWCVVLKTFPSDLNFISGNTKDIAVENFHGNINNFRDSSDTTILHNRARTWKLVKIAVTSLEILKTFHWSSMILYEVIRFTHFFGRTLLPKCCPDTSWYFCTHFHQEKRKQN